MINRALFINRAGCHLASHGPMKASVLAKQLQHDFRGVSGKELTEEIWRAVDDGDLVWGVDRNIRAF